MKAAVPKDVDAYLARLPAAQRAALAKVRRTIRAAAPDAVELIGYGIPGYKLKGKPLAYFAGLKAHCALYGLPVADFPKELKGFAMEKGTIRFTPEKPLPASLLTKLVKARAAKIAAGDERT